MPDMISLAKDLDDHSMWFFDAKPNRRAPDGTRLPSGFADLAKIWRKPSADARRYSVGIALNT